MGIEMGLSLSFLTQSFAVCSAPQTHRDLGLLRFKYLEEKLSIELEESTMRVILYEWLRIGQILLNQKKLRWEKLLAQFVHTLPEEIGRLFINIFRRRRMLSAKRRRNVGRTRSSTEGRGEVLRVVGKKNVARRLLWLTRVRNQSMSSSRSQYIHHLHWISITNVANSIEVLPLIAANLHSIHPTAHKKNNFQRNFGLAPLLSSYNTNNELQPCPSYLISWV